MSFPDAEAQYGSVPLAREELVAALAAESVHVLHGGRVRGEKESDGAGGSFPKRPRQAEDRQRTQESARVDFEVRFHRR